MGYTEDWAESKANGLAALKALMAPEESDRSELVLGGWCFS